MKKILFLLGTAWLVFSLYHADFAFNLDFWAALLPVTYALSLILLLSSR